MNNKPYGWVKNGEYVLYIEKPDSVFNYIPLYTHPVKELTDEEIAKVVYELNQKANTPKRWVTAMQIGAETIIQLRDELRKAKQK